MWHLMGMRLDLHQQPELLQLRDDGLARGEAVLPLQPADEIEVGDAVHRAQLGVDLADRHARLGIQHGGHRQAVPLAHLEIVEVMRRGDLHRAGALLRVGILVGDDGNAAAGQRQDHPLADQGGKSRILRMHRHGGIAQHRLRPGGGATRMLARPPSMG